MLGVLPPLMRGRTLSSDEDSKFQDYSLFKLSYPEEAISHPTGHHAYTTQSYHWVETELYLKFYLLYRNACLMKLSPDLSCRTKGTLDTFIEKDHIEYQSRDLLPTMRSSLSHQRVEKICPFWKKGRIKNNSKSQLANKTYWPLCLLIIKNVYFEHPRFSSWHHLPHQNGWGRWFVTSPWHKPLICYHPCCCSILHRYLSTCFLDAKHEILALFLERRSSLVNYAFIKTNLNNLLIVYTPDRTPLPPPFF